MKKIGLIFIIMFIFQLAVPLSMVIKREIILQKGEIVKFQIEPVDPFDPFRGKYLNIRVIGSRVYTDIDNYSADQKVFAILDIDSDGFASFTGVSLSPLKNDLSIECKIDSFGGDFILLELPFNRYYINEKYSKLGEELYLKYSRGDRDDAYITVRIKEGKAVLEDMFLNGMEINKFIEKELKKGADN